MLNNCAKFIFSNNMYLKGMKESEKKNNESHNIGFHCKRKEKIYGNMGKTKNPQHHFLPDVLLSCHN